MNNFNYNPDLDLPFPSSLHPSPQPPSTTQRTQDVVVSASALASPSSSTYLETNVPHRMKKKRSKQTRPDVGDSSSSRAKPAKKPDPTAPKITTPCSECGRKFWSWKALFGHMRCHPERHWRGIQPPPQRHVVQSPSSPMMTQDDHDAASSLLILADQGGVGPRGGGGENDSRFQCSSCKKVFGSHQALGGHRASHKNVKGCFAINNPTDDFAADQQQDNHPPPHAYEEGADIAAELEEAGHQCGICQRVFSSGQALGGHKRCHWERGEDSSSTHLPSYGVGGGLDLNLPASAVTTTTTGVEDDHHQSTSSYSCSGLALDLRLGL